MKIIKIIFYLCLISLINTKIIIAEDFDSWVFSFKNYAMKKGISKKTLDETMSKVKFLPKVIEYDRYQPEFYEDTKTYIYKRTSIEKLKKGTELFKKNNSFISDIESKFDVKVLKVATIRQIGKHKQMTVRSGGRTIRTMGKRSDYKKAIITLESNSSIDIMRGETSS